jgi:hypothetical protein
MGSPIWPILPKNRASIVEGPSFQNHKLKKRNRNSGVHEGRTGFLSEKLRRAKK